MKKEQLDAERKEQSEILEAQRALKKHLKSLSKNELINTVMDLAATVIQTTELNKALNNAVDVLKQERAQNEKSDTITSTATA
jgi:hypothetical protein